MVRYNPETLYIDSGRRTPQEHTVGNMLLGYFHQTKGRTFEEMIDAVIASGWKPQKSELYNDRPEKSRYLRGYLVWLASNDYLISKGD
ncbi:MAG: hypothetical protein ABFS24_13110 [Pseudomonadota bacterium]